MSTPETPHQGTHGGFDRPEFTAGPGIDGKGPHGETRLDAMEGTREDIVRREQALREEQLKGNRHRRYRFLIAAATAVAVMALIVALVVWFWSADPYSLGVTGI